MGSFVAVLGIALVLFIWLVAVSLRITYSLSRFTLSLVFRYPRFCCYFIPTTAIVLWGLDWGANLAALLAIFFLGSSLALYPTFAPAKSLPPQTEEYEELP